MAERDPLEELKLLLRSRHGLAAIETLEEDRLETLVTHLADQMGLPLFVWTRTRALRRIDEDSAIYGTESADGAVGHIIAAQYPAIYHFRGFATDLENQVLAEKMKEAGGMMGDRTGIILLTGEPLQIPHALQPHVAMIALPAPNLDDFRELLVQLIRDISAHTPLQIRITEDELNQLLKNLQGLTLMEAEKVLTKALVIDNALSAEDIRVVIDAKREIVQRDGILEYYPLEQAFSEVADLTGLKTWLAKRRALIENPLQAAEYGLSFPRGVLLVGIPGTGKSLCAKAVAMEWKLPLLKMDPASLYNKYVGETERNFRRAMETAEKMAPVVLWIDEIEKAFSSSSDSEDGGVSTRVLGTFLSWLQERSGDVFVVATANDVSRLPPELLRKGRFDEIFFVDLPDTEAREALVEIHLRKRGQDPKAFESRLLAEMTAGFSGADIEQVIVSGLYTGFAKRQPLSTDILLEEIRQTRPLSKTMPERISALREWSRGRTVPAN